MTARDVPVRIEELLAHREWVARLALVLTRDPDAADDAVQQTWMAALVSPPRHDASPRGWLAAVLRNAVRARGRGEARRARREEAFARAAPGGVSGDADDPAATVARAELHAAVAAAVVALPEPYRRAILLRHFEERPVSEVAQRMGTPLETARSRLRRGRAMLRERLERDVGGGLPLAVVLMPLTGGVGGGRDAAGAAAGSGGVAMGAKTVAVAAGAVLLAVSGTLWWMAQDGGDGTTTQREVAIAPGGVAAGAAVDEPADEPAAGAGEAFGAGVGGAPERSAPARERGHVAQGEAAAEVESDPVAADTREPEADAGPMAEPGPAPPEEPESVADRLGRPVTLALDDVPLRELIGRIAWIADVPIYADLDVVGVLDQERSSLNLQSAEARTALSFAVVLGGLEMREEEERVVLHPQGIEWDDGRRVQRVDPVPAPRAMDPVRIHGLVVAPDGKPVAGATVLGFGQTLTADARGAFETDVEPRTYYPWAQASGYVESPRRQLVVAEGSGSLDVRLEMAAVAARLVVRVSSSGENDLSSASVRVFRRGEIVSSHVTDAMGVVRLDQLPAGRVELRVVAPGHAPADETVVGIAGESTDVAVVLEPRSLAERIRTELGSVEIDHQPLSGAIGMLNATWDVHVVFDRYVGDDVRRKIVSVPVTDQTLEYALNEICRATGTTFRVDEERSLVWISVPK